MMPNTLIISDLHLPYQHRDAFKFLDAIGYEYAIEDVYSAGDLCDNHSSSFHISEYGTLSAQDEYHKAAKLCRELEEIFPEMIIVEGNHCIMSNRKAKQAEIPLEHIKSYNDMYGVQDGWEWKSHEFITIDEDTNQQCLLTHDVGAGLQANASKFSHCSVQGHHHGKFGIMYFADKESLRWHMTVGCLIDGKSPAFNYAKGTIINKPILGSGLILDGKPVLVPMTLTKSGRWDNKLISI